jgi:uncharacterized membrane protein
MATRRRRVARGYVPSVVGTLVGALVAWTISLVAASALANAVSPSETSDQVVPYFVTMLLMTAVGGSLGCWVALAAVGERRAMRTGLVVLVLYLVLLSASEIGTASVNASGNGFFAVAVLVLSAMLSTVLARRFAIRGMGRQFRA